jgi:asparagine synthase (glutamine-hydrolysing)
MCGIAGYLDRGRRLAHAALAARARAMNDSIAHRGPDGADVWTDAEAGIALAHRRLAIIDLSDEGRQPMMSSDGRYVVSFNGEIYNYRALHADLEAQGVRFHGRSDTEAMLEGFANWGVEATLARLEGMYAIALWDRRERRLRLVRDPLGIKPLYYTHAGDTLAFGSELKALHAVSGWQPTLDRDSLSSYLRYGYVPAPHTIYREARKLGPGEILDWQEGIAPRVEAFWSMRDVACAGQRGRDGPTEPIDATDRLDAVLREAVRDQIVSDVPLGAFLSGGIDSSTVVALMQAQSARPVRTFSIGFAADGYDEAAHAKAVAAHLGTDHTELYVEPAHALSLVPRLPDLYDEPFADSSQIPTFLLAQMTRRHVTVALSGDGGDEGFAGYNRYAWADRLWRHAGGLPAGLRHALGWLVELPGPGPYDALAGLVAAARPGEKAMKVAALLRADGPDDAYRRLASLWQGPDRLVRGGAERPGPANDPTLEADLPDFVARMQFLDYATYLHDDVLTKVDRASMAVGLEARVPLLDTRVVRFAWSLPPALKLRGTTGKWLLRQVLARYVPPALTERPKMGFAMPVGNWLRGPLREWAEDLLSPAELAVDGAIDPGPVRATWAAHLAGRRDYSQRLWAILMFQAWQRRWKAS